jgi:hypothetical protein
VLGAPITTWAAVPRIAGSQHFNNVWPLSAGLAGRVHPARTGRPIRDIRRNPLDLIAGERVELMTSASGFVISHSGSGKNGACVSNGYCDQLAYAARGGGCRECFRANRCQPGNAPSNCMGRCVDTRQAKHKSKK